MASFSPEEVELIKSRGNDVRSFCHFLSMRRRNMRNVNAVTGRSHILKLSDFGNNVWDFQCFFMRNYWFDIFSSVVTRL
jgi:hypothetical protein